MSKSLTQSEENYLKAIYSLEERHSGAISTNDLAEVMETKARMIDEDGGSGGSSGGGSSR